MDYRPSPIGGLNGHNIESGMGKIEKGFES